jgi:predicted nucleotidyltransferase
MPISADAGFLADYKRRAEAALPGRVVKVVLYGSRARGDAESESDWDVAVFLKDAPQEEDRRTVSGLAFEVGLENGVFIQTVVLPVSREVEQSSFMRRVRSEGIAI